MTRLQEEIPRAATKEVVNFEEMSVQDEEAHTGGACLNQKTKLYGCSFKAFFVVCGFYAVCENGTRSCFEECV